MFNRLKLQNNLSISRISKIHKLNYSFNMLKQVDTYDFNMLENHLNRLKELCHNYNRF